MSVDTYLQGKKTNGYRREHVEDVTILLAPSLMNFADKVQLVTRKKIIGGKKLIALAHHEHTSACRH